MITTPFPFKYGLAFDPVPFVPIAFLYLVTAIESAGDLTANSVIAGEPVEGPVYLERIRGGILGDGVNSAIAAVFNSFPNTTFSQNNGVIQMTGIASRHVALYVASILFMLGLFPVVGAVFSIIPPSARRDCLCQAVRLTRVDSGGVEHVEPSAGNHG